ncbi:MAG: PEP-utilizing enzyme [Patescibacteria group bacterium]
MVNKFPHLKKYTFSKDILANRDWYEKSWAGVLFSLYNIGYGCVYMFNKRYHNALRISITFVKNDHMSWLWDMRDMKWVRARLLSDIRHGSRIINKYRRQWRVDWAAFKKTVAQLGNTDLSRLSDQALYNAYLRLRDTYNAANSTPYLVDSFLTTGENDWLAELIKSELSGKAGEQELPDYLAKLSAPTANSFSNREAIDLLKVAVAYQRHHDSAELTQGLRRHAKKYYWIENSYYPKEPLTEQYFRTKISPLLKSPQTAAKLRTEQNRIKLNKAAKIKLLKQLKISADLRRIIRTVEIFTAWQDDRKSNVFIANHFFFLILREIGRRTGLKPFEMYYTTDHELPDILFKRKFDRRRWQRRRQAGCMFVNTPRGIYLAEGKAAAKYSKEDFLGIKRGVTEIKGVGAAPGQARGLVRVITNIENFRQFKSGEILVTNNTTPDFVPIMKKAAAIVTEQGGITTHAAIVSRELGVPCVIGTKIATQVLHDGDLVEVDAHRGLVKILKNDKIKNK